MGRTTTRHGYETPIERELRRDRPVPPDALVARVLARIDGPAVAPRAPRLAAADAATAAAAAAFAGVGGVDYAAAAAKKAASAVATVAKSSSSGKPVVPLRPGGRGGAPPQAQGQGPGQGQSQGQGQAKVTICHRTGSSSNPYVRITVAQPAVGAHQSHGDLVPAPATCPDGTPADGQYKPGKGCGDKNHVHFREGQCKGGAAKR